MHSALVLVRNATKSLSWLIDRDAGIERLRENEVQEEAASKNQSQGNQKEEVIKSTAGTPVLETPALTQSTFLEGPYGLISTLPKKPDVQSLDDPRRFAPRQRRGSPEMALPLGNISAFLGTLGEPE